MVTALDALTQEDLESYVELRSDETIVRWGKATKFAVSPGTIGNELSSLALALRLAKKGPMVDGKRQPIKVAPTLISVP